jgi:hypothetical protein
MCSFVHCAELANLVQIWYLVNSPELSTSFHPGFLSGHSRMSMPALGSGSWKKRGFKGALLGTVGMALFVKIAGRKKGISPHLTLYHGLIQ